MLAQLFHASSASQVLELAGQPQVLKIAIYLLGSVYLIRFVRIWCREAGHIKHESGYSTPISRLWARLVAFLIAILAAALLVGKVKSHGSESAIAQRKRYRFVVVSNHQIQADAIVLGRLAKLRRWRFMVAMEEVRRPLLAPLYALVGAVPVIRRGSQAAQDPAVSSHAAADAVTGAVKALAGDKNASLIQRGLVGTLMLIALSALTSALHMWVAIPLTVLTVLATMDLFIRQATHFLIFGQGKLIPTDLLRPEDFRTGPIRIAREVAEVTGDEVALLVVHVRYEYDRRFAGLLTRLLMLIRFPRRFFGAQAVYRADVDVSQPMPLNNLPTDDDEANKLVFEEMTRLKAIGDARAASMVTPV